MKGAGILFAVIGAGLLLFGLMMDVSASTGSSGLYGLPDRVANAHAMHIQGLMVIAGVGASLVGAVLYGFGAVVEAIGRPGGEAADPAPVVPAAPMFTMRDAKQLGLIIGLFVALMLGIAFFFPDNRPSASSGPYDGESSANALIERRKAESEAAMNATSQYR